MKPVTYILTILTWSWYSKSVTFSYHVYVCYISDFFNTSHTSYDISDFFSISNIWVTCIIYIFNTNHVYVISAIWEGCTRPVMSALVYQTLHCCFCQAVISSPAGLYGGKKYTQAAQFCFGVGGKNWPNSLSRTRNDWAISSESFEFIKLWSPNHPDLTDPNKSYLQKDKQV